LRRFQERLDACRQAAASVYTYLDEHGGISVNLVFQLRQLRERVQRAFAVRSTAWSRPTPGPSTARLLAHLVTVGQERRSLRALINANTQCWRPRWPSAAQRRVSTTSPATRPSTATCCARRPVAVPLTALTTWLKFSIMALGLSSVLGGFWAGADLCRQLRPDPAAASGRWPPSSPP
jgi:site-specific recombinase